MTAQPNRTVQCVGEGLEAALRKVAEEDWHRRRAKALAAWQAEAWWVRLLAALMRRPFRLLGLGGKPDPHAVFVPEAGYSPPSMLDPDQFVCDPGVSTKRSAVVKTRSETS